MIVSTDRSARLRRYSLQLDQYGIRAKNSFHYSIVLRMINFLHASDIHLDSPLRGLARYEGAPVEEIRLATRRALENLVELAIRESVDFVVLAGDLYDGDWPDFDTGLFFVGQMHRLREAGIPVFEKNFSLTDVYGADEAFVTGTFAGVVPATEVDGRGLTDGRGPMVARLQDLYRARIEADVAAQARP